MVWHGMEWALPCNIAKNTLHEDNHCAEQPILPRSSPGTRTAPSFAGHQDGGEKYATDGPNPYVPETTSLLIGTRHVRSLTAVGTVEEQGHKTKRYRWNILGLCVVRWGKKTSEERLPQKATNSPSVGGKTGMSMSWISHSQGHCECQHVMPISLLSTQYHSSEGIAF